MFDSRIGSAERERTHMPKESSNWPESLTVRGVDYGTPDFHYQAKNQLGEWTNILTESVRELERQGILIHWNPTQ